MSTVSRGFKGGGGAPASSCRRPAPQVLVLLLLLRPPGAARKRRAGQLLAVFRDFLDDAHPAYPPEEIERYVEAWSQPGGATAMINYYRSSVRQSPKHAEAQLRPLSTPTLVSWGQRGRYLGPELAEPDRADVPNLDRVERRPDASHWVHHDEAERVNQLLIDFFTPTPPTRHR